MITCLEWSVKLNKMPMIEITKAKQLLLFAVIFIKKLIKPEQK